MERKFKIGDVIRNVQPYQGEPAWQITGIDGTYYTAESVAVVETENFIQLSSLMRIEDTDMYYAKRQSVQ